MPLTITEALAEIKTIGKRIDKKTEFVVGLLWRQEAFKDPMEADGGSPQVISREAQSILDLEMRLLTLRRSIQRANDNTSVTIGTTTMSISDWLVWRRDVAPLRQKMLGAVARNLAEMRSKAKQMNVSVIQPGNEVTAPKDIVVNISEANLAKEIEGLETVLGQLDGQLSLKNATVIVDDAPLNTATDSVQPVPVQPAPEQPPSV